MSVRINTNIEALDAQRNLSATALTFSKSVEKLSSGLRINRAADDAAGLAISQKLTAQVTSLNQAQRNLSATANSFAKSVEKLSSGLRINRAADDAAGLAISQKLQAQVTSLNQAQRNAQDGISMVQTAEGALNEVHSMLQRIRELAVEAANSTLSKEDAASVATEITALRDEIDRIAGATTFNGQNLLTGTLSVSQSGGGLAAGTALNTGHAAAIAAVDVSGAKGNTTYTLTSQAGGKVTLADGDGHMQQITLAAIGATGFETINFDSLGVKITVTGAAAKTAAELATDLAAPGSTPVTVGIGGASGSDLVNGDVLSQPVTTPVVATGSVTYGNGLDNSGGTTPMTATASAGTPVGRFTLWADGVGDVSGTLGGENFTGTFVADPGNASSVTLTGDAGHTIVLNFQQTATATLAKVGLDLAGAAFTFGGNATVSGLAVSGGSTGTYTFTSTAPGSLTLTGPDGPVTTAVYDMYPGDTQTLTFGNVSFTLTDSGTGYSPSSIIASLTSPADDTIVVASSGGGGGAATIVTGAGTDANFQIGANAGDFLGVSFSNAQVAAGGYGTWNADITAFANATSTGNGIIAAAQNLISSSDTAIGYVSTTRGNLGAVQNRLEHTTASISVASENLNASQSRIRDLDVASEMVNFTKTQILQQAGTAILAQANQAPQSILSLLK